MDNETRGEGLMRIPSRLKISGRMVKVEKHSSIDMDGYMGCFTPWANRIRIAIDPELDGQQHGVSLIHEIIECLNERHEYKIPHPVITGLAENLYQVLRDNDLDFGCRAESKPVGSPDEKF